MPSGYRVCAIVEPVCAPWGAGRLCLGMAGKRGTARRGIAAQARALIAGTANLPIDELERRAKAVSMLAKARQALNEIDAREDMINGHDDRLDAAGEQQLRDELLRRLDEIAAEVAPAEDAELDGPGSAETAGG